MKMETSSGILIQMVENISIGVIATRRGGLMPRCLRASMAGSETKRHSGFVKVRDTKNATTKPIRARNMRVRNSSKWSMKDIRSMPSSSSSPSSEGGGGGVG